MSEQLLKCKCGIEDCAMGLLVTYVKEENLFILQPTLDVHTAMGEPVILDESGLEHLWQFVQENIQL